MAGSLIKIQETTVTSAVASVTLGGTNWNSSFDVYLVKVNNMQSDTDANDLFYRVVNSSGVAQTTSNYDYARKVLRTDTTFSNSAVTNTDKFQDIRGGTGTGEQFNGIFYLFNFNNASEYSFVTSETTAFDEVAKLAGTAGGGVYTVAEQHYGLQFLYNSNNIEAGTFTLYGLKK